MAAENVSLVGIWTGPRERIAKTEGLREGVATLVIAEQKGPTSRAISLARTRTAM